MAGARLRFDDLRPWDRVGTRAGDGAVTPVFSDLEANRHDGERERNGGKANGKCKRDHHGIPLCDKDAPGPVNEKQTQALLLPSPPRRIYAVTILAIWLPRFVQAPG